MRHVLIAMVLFAFLAGPAVTGGVCALTVPTAMVLLSGLGRLLWTAVVPRLSRRQNQTVLDFIEENLLNE